MGSGERKPNRVAGLDVVRSVAIMLVLVSHCGDVFSAWYDTRMPLYVSVSGFFGVELFFVLSGFLIGRLLIDIIAARPDFRAWLVFMTRRWMRTLPLYFLCLGILALVWPPYFWEPGRDRLWQALPWYLTLTQNLAWPMVSQWFGVTWSLTVEEWFYLLFSALLIGGVAWTGRRWLWVTALVFLCAPPVMRWNLPVDVDWGEVTAKVVLYRLDSIVFGAVVACLEAAGSPLLHRPFLLLTAGAAIVAFVWAGGMSSVLGLSKHFQDTFIFDFVSTGFALMLPAAALPNDIWRVAARPVRLVSQQSYCLYLIHLPMLEIMSYYRGHYGLPTFVCVMVTLGSGWIVSYFSYRWIERPILALRPRQDVAFAARGRAMPLDASASRTEEAQGGRRTPAARLGQDVPLASRPAD